MPRIASAIHAATALVLLCSCSAPGPSPFEEAGDVARGLEVEAPRMRAPRTPPIEIRTSSTYLPERSFDSGAGKISRYQVEVELESGTPLSEDTELIGRMGIGRIRYGFSGPASELAPAATEPFERLDTYLFELGIRTQLSPEWTAQVRIEGDTVAASGAHFHDSWSLAGSVDFGYAPSPNWLWIFGLGVQSRLEQDPLPFPRLGFLYRDDDWLAALYGPQLRIQRRLGEGLRAGLFGSFDFQDARLSASAAVAHGVLRERRIAFGPTLSWWPSAGLELRADLGWTVYHEMQLDGRYGERGPEVDVELGPSFQISLEWTPRVPGRARAAH